MTNKQIIKFDTMASKLGLDGEQMDELRDLFRKALYHQCQEFKRVIESYKWKDNSDESAAHNQSLTDILRVVKKL